MARNVTTGVSGCQWPDCRCAAVCVSEAISGGMSFRYRAELTRPGLSTIVEDWATPLKGETPEQCVRRGARATGWRIVKLRILLA